MARPREFDTAKVLQQIVDVFWREGFDRTSFRMLEKATGLKKASLFAAYGDKKALFLQALRLYQEWTINEFAGSSATCRSPRKALETWLHKAAGKNKDARCGPGCFILNTLIAAAAYNPACGRIIAEHREKLASLLEKIVHEGIAAGEFSRSLKPKKAAQFLLCIGSGLQTMDRDTRGQEVVRGRNPGHPNQNAAQVIELTLRALKA